MMRPLHLVLGVMAFGGFVAVMAFGCAPAPTADLAITHASVVDVRGGRLLEDQTILIKGGRIASVGPAERSSVPARARTVDGRGRYLIPGLADMHVHLSLGVPMARRADETEIVLTRMLNYGVTSVLALGGTDQSTDMVSALRARQAEGALKGPWIYATGGHLTLPGTHPVVAIFPREVRAAADAIVADTPPEVPADLYEIGLGISLVRTDEAARAAVRERAAGGMDAIKITVESGPGPFGTHHPQMPLSMIRAIVDEAALHGLPVFAHASSPDELRDALDGGAAGVVHAVIDEPLPGRAVGERMHRENFYYVPTLTLYENFIGYWNEPSAFDDPFLRATASADEVATFWDSGFIARHRSTFDYFDGPVTPLPATGATPEPTGPKRTEATVENVGFLHSLGVPMVVGTDTGNPFTFPGYSVHQELELLVRAGLTPMDALVAGTLRAAEMLGKEDDFGTIEAGKRADLVLLDANPLDDILNTRTIQAVVANGMYLDRAALDALVAGAATDHPPGGTEQVGVSRSATGVATEALSDSARVAETLEDFIRAFNDLDLGPFIAHFDDSATVFHPLPNLPLRHDGRTEIEMSFESFFDAVRAAQSGPPYLSIEPHELHIQMLGDVAIATFHLWPEAPSVGRRTIVLHQRDGRWLIVHLHASMSEG